MNNYTKGPWRVVGQSIFGNEQNGYICEWSGRRADAYLITAAPELLEVLKAVMARTSASEVREPTWGRALKAIAKAEGR